MADKRQQSEISRRIELPGTEITVHVGKEETDGRYSLLEYTVEPGFDVSPHWHRELTEAFYVLNGSMTFSIDGTERTAGPGEFLFVPPRTIHSVEAVGDDSCRFLLVVSPGGFEDYLREGEELFEEAGGKPPEDLVQEVRSRHDVRDPPVEDSHPN